MKVPLRDDRYDLDAMLEAIGPRTNIVFVCHPNNPTGTMNTRAELDAFLDAVPEHVLVVLDQAYREYVGDPEYPDAIEEYFRAGRRVAVLRTFSKIYGLAGLRVGYMVAPEEVVLNANKVKRAFDVSSAAQSAALASLDDTAELERRRAVNAESIQGLARTAPRAGLRAGGGQSPTSSTSTPARTCGRSSRRSSPRARSSARCTASARRLRFASRTGRRTTTGSSPKRSPASRRVNVPPRATAADPVAPGGDPPRVAVVPAPVRLDADLGAGDVDRRNRAGPGRQGTNRLGNMGERAADCGLPSGRCDRPAARAARRPSVSQAAPRRQPTSSGLPPSSCSRWPSTPTQIVALALLAGIAQRLRAAGRVRRAAEPRLRGIASRANSMLRTADQLTVMAGTVLGGIIVAASGPDLAYWLNAGSFVVSAVLILRISARTAPGGEGAEQRPLGRCRRGLPRDPALAAAAGRARSWSVATVTIAVVECRRGLPGHDGVPRGGVRLRPDVDRGRVRSGDRRAVRLAWMERRALRRSTRLRSR